MTPSDVPARIAVGSTNPVKVDAVRAVLARAGYACQVEGVAVESGVPDQPWGDAETRRGASARARAAMARTGCSLGIGIEGGVVDEGDGSLRTCAWAVAVTADGREGIGGSLSMPLPPRVTAQIRAGAELGVAMDRITGLENVKRHQGAVGILTDGVVDRRQAYEVLVAYALAPMLSAPLWSADA